MWPNPQKTPDLVTFTEEMLNGKLYFLPHDNVSFNVFEYLVLIGDRHLLLTPYKLTFELQTYCSHSTRLYETEGFLR